MDESGLKPLAILGCGPGGADFVTPAVRREASIADWVGGYSASLDLLEVEPQRRVVVGRDLEAWLEEIARLRSRRDRVAVAVSGDPGLCSLSARVLAHCGRAHCRVLPGVSSVQSAFAAVGEDWMGCQVLSAHAGWPEVDPQTLSGHPKLAVLAGNPVAATWIETLARTLESTHRIVACENLTLPTERIHAWESRRFDELASKTVLLFLKRNPA